MDAGDTVPLEDEEVGLNVLEKDASRDWVTSVRDVVLDGLRDPENEFVHDDVFVSGARIVMVEDLE